MDVTTYVECYCFDHHHLARVVYYDWGRDEMPDVYWYVQLNPRPLWKRVWLALTYIAGRQSKNGHWESGSIGRDSAIALHKVLDTYINHPHAM